MDIFEPFPYYVCFRSDTSNAKSKLRDARSVRKRLEAEAKENKRKENTLREKITNTKTKANDLERHKQDLAAQNKFLKNFLTLVSRLCSKTEVIFLFLLFNCFSVQTTTGAVRDNWSCNKDEVVAGI